MDDAGSSPVTGTKELYNSYMRDYLRRRYAERSRRAVEILGGACSKCGSEKDLEFDHIDPSSKLFEVRYLLYKRRFDDKDLVEELRKCQLLCKGCHKAKSDLEKSVGHGGGLSGKKNCKCGPCKVRKAEYMSSRPTYNQNRCRKKDCSCGKRHYPAG